LAAYSVLIGGRQHDVTQRRLNRLHLLTEQRNFSPVTINTDAR